VRQQPISLIKDRRREEHPSNYRRVIPENRPPLPRPAEAPTMRHIHGCCCLPGDDRGQCQRSDHLPANLRLLRPGTVWTLTLLRPATALCL